MENIYDSVKYWLNSAEENYLTMKHLIDSWIMRGLYS